MRRTATVALLVLVGGSILLGQRGRRSFFDEEDTPAAIPPDANDKTEYTFARLRYDSGYGGYRRRGEAGPRTTRRLTASSFRESAG